MASELMSEDPHLVLTLHAALALPTQYLPIQIGRVWDTVSVGVRHHIYQTGHCRLTLQSLRKIHYLRLPIAYKAAETLDDAGSQAPVHSLYPSTFKFLIKELQHPVERKWSP